MLGKFFFFWVIIVLIRAILEAYKSYNMFRKAGFNTVLFEKTGQKIPFHGGSKEAVSCTLVGALGMIFSPSFLLITTLFYYLPAVLVLFLVS